MAKHSLIPELRDQAQVLLMSDKREMERHPLSSSYWKELVDATA